MNDIDRIKAKIKKLLALSRSPNPNESASALKMAQELMVEFKIGQADVNAADIGEEAVRTLYRENPPRYESRLIGAISRAFGCKTVYYNNGKRCTWRFTGLRHRAEIAAYIGKVLIRKIRNARAEYIKTLYRVRLKYRKTQRADDFCLAWVDAVTGKLPLFAGVSDAEKKAIELFCSENNPGAKKLVSITRSFNKDVDYHNGARAGGGVQLQHGVGVHSQGSLLLGG